VPAWELCVCRACPRLERRLGGHSGQSHHTGSRSRSGRWLLRTVWWLNFVCALSPMLLARLFSVPPRFLRFSSFAQPVFPSCPARLPPRRPLPRSGLPRGTRVEGAKDTRRGREQRLSTCPPAASPSPPCPSTKTYNQGNTTPPPTLPRRLTSEYSHPAVYFTFCLTEPVDFSLVPWTGAFMSLSLGRRSSQAARTIVFLFLGLALQMAACWPTASGRWHAF